MQYEDDDDEQCIFHDDLYGSMEFLVESLAGADIVLDEALEAIKDVPRTYWPPKMDKLVALLSDRGFKKHLATILALCHTQMRNLTNIAH